MNNNNAQQGCGDENNDINDDDDNVNRSTNCNKNRKNKQQTSSSSFLVSNEYDPTTTIDRKEKRVQIEVEYMNRFTNRVRDVRKQLVVDITNTNNDIDKYSNNNNNNSTFAHVQLEPLEEQYIFDTCKVDLMKGVFVGCISFVTIRWLRSTIPKLLVFNTVHQKQPTQVLTTTIVHQQQQSLQSRIYNIITILLDGSASFAIATTASLLFLNNNKVVYDKLSKLPLIEGKSFLADLYCPVMVDEYKQILSEVNDMMILKQKEQEQQHDHLDSDSSSSSSSSSSSTSYSKKSLHYDTSIFDQATESPPPQNNNNISQSSIRGEGGVALLLKDVIENPQSIQLIGLFNYCKNCQRRTAYEQNGSSTTGT